MVTLQNGDTGTGKLKTSADTQEEEDEERGSHVFGVRVKESRQTQQRRSATGHMAEEGWERQ